MGKNDELLNKYINGDDLSEETIEKLENNKYFMEKVIDITNDPKMYHYCSKKVKTDPGFIRFLMKKFINNLDFICDAVDYYFNNSQCDEESVIDNDYVEIAIILRAILKRKDDDRYTRYDLMEDVMYASLRFQVEDAKREYKDDYEYQYDMGLGFWYIFDTYMNNEIVINYYARKMLNEIFIEDYYALDKILHNKYSTVEEIEDKGIYCVLINVISIYDNMLAAYVAVHKDLLKKPIKKLGYVLKRWNKYVDLKETNMYEQIFTDVEEYMRDKDENSILSEKDLLTFIGLNLGITDKLVQHQLIDLIDVNIVKEEQNNIIETIKSSLPDRINYNNVKSIIKSIIFPNQNRLEDTRTAGKILRLDDFRKKQEKEKVDKID